MCRGRARLSGRVISPVSLLLAIPILFSVATQHFATAHSLPLVEGNLGVKSRLEARRTNA